MRYALLFALLAWLAAQPAHALVVTNLTREPQSIVVGSLSYSRQVVLAPGETYREMLKPSTVRLADGVGEIRSNDGDDEYAIWPTRNGARLAIQKRAKSHRGDGIF